MCVAVRVAVRVAVCVAVCYSVCCSACCSVCQMMCTRRLGKHCVVYVDESCHTFKWVRWTRHVTCVSIMSQGWKSHVMRVDESCQAYRCVMLRVWMGYVTHVKKSFRATWMGHVARVNRSCRTYPAVKREREREREGGREGEAKLHNSLFQMCCPNGWLN